MQLILSNHSSYPRVGEGPEAQRVRRAYAKRETGEVTDEGYLEVCRDYIAEIVREQEQAGCDLVTDGQVHWYDLVTHPASRLEGIRINGLLRFFDTNYLVRRPEIVGPVKGSIGAADDFRYTSSVASSEVKAVLTGPYTLARHAILRSDDHPDIPSVTLAFAEALAEDVRQLAETGAGVIQVEEPSLLLHPTDAPVVRQALERLAAGKGAARISLVTYFGDATPLYGTLLDMPADIIGFDLRYGPGLADLIATSGADRPLALGAIDGRNTKLEDVEETARLVAKVIEVLDARGINEVHLQPSCGLEYLPRDRAVRKLERMREIGNALEKVGA